MTLLDVKRITRAREALGWSRAELARHAIMDAGTIGKIEAGRLVPYPAQLEKIAAALEFEGDPAALLDEVG